MKTILLTGATDGIGKQTAIEIAEQNHNLIVHGRNQEKCLELTNWLKESSGNENIKYFCSDFSSLNSVKTMCKAIISANIKFDVIINNAGIYANNLVYTEDGFESTFGINHLAPFLLTNLLLNNLKDNARIVNVSSVAHLRATLEWDNLNSQKHFDDYSAYSLSKLANVLFSNYLAKKLENVTVNSLHPGVISTKLLHSGFSVQGAPLSEGSKTSLYLALADDVEGITGKYFSDSKLAEMSPLAKSTQNQEKMWKLSEEMVGLK